MNMKENDHTKGVSPQKTERATLEVNMPDRFLELSDDDKRVLIAWIKNNIFPRKTFNQRQSSYSLKHIFERTEDGFYTTNGTFKGAMLVCGFKPRNMNDMNWIYAISQKSPAIVHRYQTVYPR